MTKRKPRSKGSPAPLARPKATVNVKMLTRLPPGKLVIVAFKDAPPEVAILMGPEPMMGDPMLFRFDSRGRIKPWSGSPVFDWSQIVRAIPGSVFDFQGSFYWLDRNGRDVWDIVEDMQDFRWKPTLKHRQRVGD